MSMLIYSILGFQASTSENEFSCNEYGKSFSGDWSLKRHITTVHVATEKQQCPFCMRFYKNKNSLTAHMNSHKQIST